MDPINFYKEFLNDAAKLRICSPQFALLFRLLYSFKLKKCLDKILLLRIRLKFVNTFDFDCVINAWSPFV